MLSLFALASILIIGNMAYPMHDIARQDSGACSNFGASGFSSTPSANFTLAALNTTLPNANSTGVPLVLGPGGAVPGEKWLTLTTYATYPFPTYWPNFRLVNNGLIANGLYGAGAGVHALPVAAGGLVEFEEPDPDAPAAIFCGVDVEGTFSRLAVNGDADSFFLCRTEYPDTYFDIVWKPSADSYDEYDYDSCFNVILQMVRD